MPVTGERLGRGRMTRHGFGADFIVTLQERITEAIRTWGYSIHADYRGRWHRWKEDSC